MNHSTQLEAENFAAMLLLLLLVQTSGADESHRVTIDLSALRPSSPGLVLYKYGDLAPKLVQVDLASLNPMLQPHVIWPQFNELEATDRPYELDSQEAIPYLTEEESLMSPRRLAKMMSSTNWLDQAAYDFVPDSLSSFQGSLPIADEVIVPLDWEVKSKRSSEPKKKNVFMTRGWRPGGEKAHKTRKGTSPNRSTQPHSRSRLGPYFQPSVAQSKSRETESEESPSSVPLRNTMGPPEAPSVRVPSQESWATPPRQYWSVPHLFVNNWQ